ncbi:hypothetical protein AMK59_5404, partial [Oryctes borbonicus]
CLSLNIPPPVKPRLEYPIPRDYVGVTPGWLRALNYQLQNNLTIPFKILWDRWIGACLQHDVLIKILCLGGFTDVNAIPWNKFLGLCAGYLTDSLTQTMILFCEIITEEPEGGSAMIPLEAFLEVYKFLAAIDASKPQTLINLYFTDSALNLFAKEKKKVVKEVESESTPSIESSTPTVEEVAEEQEAEVEIAGEGSIISCPDIVTDDVLQEPDLIDERKSEPSEEFISIRKHDEDELDEDEDKASPRGSKPDHLANDVSMTSTEFSAEPDENLFGITEQEAERESVVEAETGKGDAEAEGEAEGEREAEGEEGEKKDTEEYDDEETEEQAKEDEKVDEESVKEDAEEPTEQEEEKRKSAIEEQLKQVEKDICEKGGIELAEDEVLEEEQEEEKGDVDGREESKLSEIEGAEEGSAEGGYFREIDELEEHIRVKYEEEEGEGHEEIAEEEEPQEEVYVEAIPGIGPIVPLDLVEAVERHLTSVAAEEHGMTMPRHVRHYSCP